MFGRVLNTPLYTKVEYKETRGSFQLRSKLAKETPIFIVDFEQVFSHAGRVLGGTPRCGQPFFHPHCLKLRPVVSKIPFTLTKKFFKNYC